MVIHGRRSKPDIDLYEDDGTIRGYYRVIQGYRQTISWKELYSLNYEKDVEEEVPRPKKVPLVM